MQVSPDNNVRVTEASPIGRIPVSPENAAGLKNGDFLVATVEQVQGDTLLLRVDSGILLNAALQGNMNLTQGDVIEAAVSKDGGTCLLYIVNVLHAGGQAPKDTAVSAPPQTLSAMLSVIKRNPGLDADIALYLAQNNIPDTAENIAALSQMSRGTGIGALLGQVLELMIEPGETPQAGGNQSPVQAGGTVLSQGETMTASPGTLPEGGQSQPDSTVQSQTAVNGQSQPAPAAPGQAAVNGEPTLTGVQTQASMPGPQAAATGTNPAALDMPQADPQQVTAVPAQTRETGAQAQIANGRQDAVPASQTGEPPLSQGAGQTAAPEAQPQPSIAGTMQPQGPQGPPLNTEAVPHAVNGNVPYGAQRAAVSPTVQRETAQSGQEISPGPILQAEIAGLTGRAPQEQVEQIGRLVEGLFLQPQERTGEELKKTANEISRGLKTLKSELIQTDNKYRELCLKSVDQALRQIELADRTAHFEHMQIPIAVREGDRRTAELYVFRRKNGRKSAAEAGRSILVALDTDHMGRVETLIREESGSLSLEFRLQRPDMTETFKKNSAPLKAAVEAAGYKLSGMRFAGLEKKTTVLNAGEMVPLDAGSAPHGIDVQI